MRTLEFSVDENMSYGSWRCPSCSSEFFGGGSAIHNSGCTVKDYTGCIKVIGPKAIETIRSWAATHGDDNPAPDSEVTLNELRAQLPQHF